MRFPNLKSPVDSAKVQKIMSGIPPNITTLAQMKEGSALDDWQDNE